MNQDLSNLKNLKINNISNNNNNSPTSSITRHYSSDRNLSDTDDDLDGQIKISNSNSSAIQNYQYFHFNQNYNNNNVIQTQQPITMENNINNNNNDSPATKTNQINPESQSVVQNSSSFSLCSYLSQLCNRLCCPGSSAVIDLNAKSTKFSSPIKDYESPDPEKNAEESGEPTALSVNPIGTTESSVVSGSTGEF